jgi:hypothetical protein
MKKIVNQKSVWHKSRSISHARRRSKDFIGNLERRFEADRAARLVKKWGKEWAA